MKRDHRTREKRIGTRRRVALSVFLGAASSLAVAQSVQKPAQSQPVTSPAKVSLVDGVLAVEAHGSDLNQILGEVAQDCGMLIQGAVKPVRVFGTYGPGNPRDILSDLLVGLGYNVIMVGSAQQGAPGQLILSERNGAASPPSPVVYKAPAVTATFAPNQADAPQGVIEHPRPQPPEDDDKRRELYMQRLQRTHPQTPQ